MDFAGAYSWPNLRYLLEGFLVTLEVAALAILLSFVIAIIVAIIRYTKIPVLSQLLFVWVEMIRNLPLLLIIFFVYFALRDVGIKLGVFSAAVVGLTIFESAMISEVVRSGLMSVDKGQIEAARASGLTYGQALRYIILPQALRRMIPPIVSQFISLLKDTSLAIIIALPELMHNGQVIYNTNYSYVIPILLLIALLYFVVNFSLSLIARRLEHSR
ncbi:amino acid ABC transporter permease [Aneurinibacillus thermoaerophilus]|uniref:Amino acid ABC transporter membrane protein 2, PAAT family n=1 Tax=Aneurinibacillus thermoaerophilus TaxID=143495 RepID=A0A1G8AIG9_ANETH|nr:MULTISPECIES: amino acid ABC transporter permease [Aneurinibacillus]AMA71526.1 glutamine ABC transporter permease [Aneurinibacillus sp. XH2]MED0675288.1 amino acid ABC transporter permease [Aneurinibacillus thermoaerophilus]MED0678580.1 amino acid ABC transporter permease [Aneurinibacillus thermoaerophilus]MED0759014.1 amino acid ABC transporter permease [Aneurinibacillus thermoaerophilus]MED0762533.1 amino acid ABC transporter permease [Aneurinibacillus thermoaerophilus]